MTEIIRPTQAYASKAGRTVGGWPWLTRTILFLAALLVSTVFAARPAEAAITSCSISTAGVTFSPYNPVSQSSVTSSGTLVVTCTGDGQNTLRLALTGGNRNDCDSRRMTSSEDQLEYAIYSDSARVMNWCSGSSALTFVMDLSVQSSASVTLTMYGRIPSGESPKVGSYSDTLLATILSSGATVASAPVPINGSVAATCSVSANTLGFGRYDPQAIKTSTTGITVKCGDGLAYAVGLGSGQNFNGVSRRLKGPGSSYLAYDLFKDAGNLNAWGSGTTLGTKVNRTGTGSNQSLTVYGRITAGQQPTAGSYADSVQITVDY